MAKGIEIPIYTDTARAVSGVETLADALEETGDAADKAAKSSDRAAQLTDSQYRTLARSLEQHARKMGTSMQDAFEDIERSARESGTEISDEVLDALRDIATKGPDDIAKVRDAMSDLERDAKEAAEGVKDEFQANQIEPDDIFRESLKAELVGNMVEAGAETVRGFKDGFDSEDVGTIVDGLSDTMVAVGAIGGPVGAAAGLAGGAILNIFAGGLMADAEQKAADFESTFTTAFDRIVEAGAEMGREMAIQSAASEIYKDQDRLNDATRVANELGVERGVIIRALSGDEVAYSAVVDAGSKSMADRQARYDELDDKQRRGVQMTADEAQELVRLGEAMHDLDGDMSSVTGSYENHTDAVNAAAEAVKAKNEVDSIAADRQIKLAQETAKTTGQVQELEVRIDGATHKLQVMPDGKTIRVTDDNTVLGTQQAINGIQGRTVNVDVVGDVSGLEGIIRNFVAPTVTVPIKAGPLQGMPAGSGVLRSGWAGGSNLGG